MKKIEIEECDYCTNCKLVEQYNELVERIEDTINYIYYCKRNEEFMYSIGLQSEDEMRSVILIYNLLLEHLEKGDSNE